MEGDLGAWLYQSKMKFTGKKFKETLLSLFIKKTSGMYTGGGSVFLNYWALPSSVFGLGCLFSSWSFLVRYEVRLVRIHLFSVVFAMCGRY